MALFDSAKNTLAETSTTITPQNSGLFNSTSNTITPSPITFPANPTNSGLFSSASNTLNTGLGANALAAAQSSGPAPQNTGEARTAVESYAPPAPTFYKPEAPVQGYDPQTVFDVSGKALSYDAYLAAGGKPDFSNVKPGSPWMQATPPIVQPTSQPQNPPVTIPPVTPAPATASPTIDTQSTDVSKTLTSPAVDFQLANDPNYQQLLKDRAEFNNVVNQGKSLTDTYTEITNQLGIPAINTQLLNWKNIIDGTEDDIRAEITKTGGFATESQVLALTNSRNKQLIKNYNNLLDTKQMAMETLNTMIGLAGQDRQFALNAINQKLQIDQQIIDYGQKMQTNAQNTLNKIVEQVGYAGLAQMTGGDPYYTSLVEKTLGLGSGGLAQLAAFKKPLTQKEQLELEKTKLDIEKSKADITKIPFETSKLQAETAKAQAEAFKALNETDLKTQIVDINGKKIAVTTDSQGNIVNEIEVGSTTDTATNQQQLATSQANINSITSLLNDNDLSGTVGPIGLGRIGLIGRLTGGRANFIAGVEQIIDQLNLDKLIQSKSQGATFGQLSDNELRVLASAATKIGTWRVRDKNGNVTGYRASEKDFKAELDKISNFAKLDYILKGGNPSDVNVQPMDDGSFWTQNSDGSMSKILDKTPTNFNSAGKPQASTFGSPLARANNNPGNLRYVGQAGATQGEGGFAKFATPEAGVKALIADIEAKKAPGGKLNSNSTLTEMIVVYAPPSENDTQLYVKQIASRLGVSPNTRIGDIDTNKLAREIALKESSSNIG